MGIISTMGPRISTSDRIYRATDDARRGKIKANIAYLGRKEFSLKACPGIRDLLIEVDRLENVPDEQRKRVLRFHEQELRILLAPEYTLMGSIGAVERYLEGLSAKQRPFLGKTPELDGLGR